MVSSTILIIIVSVVALIFLVRVFGYLIEQRNLKRQRERNRDRLKFYRSQEWED
ncbi:MAG: hypothetical protein OXJ63_05900 [Gammaproteobacteria bacterium]|nr:hypothetical protein [Gammaproteobacteria bacterium]